MVGGLSLRLVRALLLSWAGERGGYGSHIWLVLRVSVLIVTWILLQSEEGCGISQKKKPYLMDPYKEFICLSS